MSVDRKLFEAIQEVLPRVFEMSAEPLRMREARPRIKNELRDRGFLDADLQREVYRHIHQSSINELKRRKAYQGVRKILWNDRKTRTFKLLRDQELKEIASGKLPAYLGSTGSLVPETLPTSAQHIAQEKVLRDCLETALNRLEPGLVLWSSNPPSKEYLLENRLIDLFAKDAEGRPVVIELKLHRAHDRVIGQALLYRALVRKYRYPTGPIRVILVAKHISTELRMAVQELDDVELFEYTESTDPNDLTPTFKKILVSPA